jgi:DNA-binding transcriptional regulator YiaG
MAKALINDDGRWLRSVYTRRVRRRTGLSQAAFAKHIGVPVDTMRNWEQGKRSPRGPARALLRIIDRAPAIALWVLRRDDRALQRKADRDAESQGRP